MRENIRLETGVRKANTSFVGRGGFPFHRALELRLLKIYAFVVCIESTETMNVNFISKI